MTFDNFRFPAGSDVTRASAIAARSKRERRPDRVAQDRSPEAADVLSAVLVPHPALYQVGQGEACSLQRLPELCFRPGRR